MSTIIHGTNGVTFPDSSVQAKSAHGPCFSAYLSAAQTITANTWTKVPLDIKEFDLTSAFNNTSTYRFLPSVAGYYQVNGQAYLSASGFVFGTCGIYKNTSTQLKSGSYTGVQGVSVASCLVYLNGSSDYLELFAYLSGTSGIQVVSGISNTCLSATLVRAS